MGVRDWGCWGLVGVRDWECWGLVGVRDWECWGLVGARDWGYAVECGRFAGRRFLAWSAPWLARTAIRPSKTKILPVWWVSAIGRRDWAAASERCGRFLVRFR